MFSNKITTSVPGNLAKYLTPRDGCLCWFEGHPWNGGPEGLSNDYNVHNFGQNHEIK